MVRIFTRNLKLEVNCVYSKKVGHKIFT